MYEKLSDEFKDRLVTVKKVKNLNYLILLPWDMDANMKKISKQSQLYIKPNVSNFPTIKSPFKSYNLAPTKPSTIVRIAVISPVFNTTIGTYPGPIDMSNMIRQGPILQEEKDKRNCLGLCHYYGKPGHIAINHKNPTLLVTKR